MSRVGKTPIKLPAGVKVELKGENLKVEGPKGKLAGRLASGVEVKVENGQILVNMAKDHPKRNLWGVTRTTIWNMVHGASQGFAKELDIVGVGYRASVKGNILQMTLGYSHSVDYKLPEGIAAKVDANTHITVSGADKVLVGMVAAKIRSFRPPEPYQGKGVKYTSERIVRKQGKAAGAK